MRIAIVFGVGYVCGVFASVQGVVKVITQNRVPGYDIKITKHKPVDADPWADWAERAAKVPDDLLARAQRATDLRKR